MAGYKYSDFLKPYNDINAIAEKINNIEKTQIIIDRKMINKIETNRFQ